MVKDHTFALFNFGTLPEGISSSQFGPQDDTSKANIKNSENDWPKSFGQSKITFNLRGCISVTNSSSEKFLPKHGQKRGANWAKKIKNGKLALGENNRLLYIDMVCFNRLLVFIVRFIVCLFDFGIAIVANNL